MANDVFILGNILFDDFSTPTLPQFGGAQAMAVHKLPGGKRVVDTLGHDHFDPVFHGTFWGDNAASNAEALDALRISGAPTVLSWGGRSWTVIVDRCEIACHRFPHWYTYQFSCVIVEDNMFPASQPIATIDDMLQADLATAMSIVGL